MVEPFESVSLSHQLSHRRNSPRASKTASLAIYRGAQQRNTAGKRARVRLLSPACPPDAQWPCLSFRDWQRNIERERPDRGGRSLAPPNQWRARAQRLFEQRLARNLFGGRL